MSRTKDMNDALARFAEAVELSEASKEHIVAGIERTERTLRASPLRVRVERAGIVWDADAAGVWRLLWTSPDGDVPLLNAPEDARARVTLDMPEFLEACTAALRRSFSG